MTDLDKKKILIVGAGSPSNKMAIAATLASSYKVAIIEATDRIKQAIELLKQAAIASENLNNASADLKELALKLMACKHPLSSKPFYHDVPKYRRKQRRW